MSQPLPTAAWLICAGALLNRLGSLHQPFLVVYLSEARNFSPVLAGATVAGYGLGSLLSSGVGGYMSDHIGNRATIIISRLTAAACLVAIPLAPSRWLLIPLVALAGFGVDLYRPATLALLAGLAPRGRRTSVFGLFRLVVGLGYAAALIAGGLVASQSLALVFFADAAIAVVVGVLAWLLLSDLVAEPDPEPRPCNESRRGSARRFAFLLVASAAVGLVFFQKDSTLPLYIRDNGHSLAAVGVLMSVQGLVGAVMAAPVALSARLLRPRAALTAAALLVGFGFALTSIATSAAALATTVALWSIGEVFWTVFSQMRAADDAPAGFTGRYLGALGLSWSIGFVAGPLLGSAVYTWSPTSLWLGCGAAALSAALLVAGRPVGARSGGSRSAAPTA
jgi:MFS family permease